MAEKDKPGTGTVLPPAQDVIKAFGGLRPMATKLGVAVSTVQGWSTRNHIPENRHAIILKAAEDYGIELAASGASATPATPDMPKPPEKIATPSQTTPPTQPTSTAGAPPSQDTKTPQAASQNAQASANKAEEKKGDEKKDEQDKEPEKKGSVPSSKGASGTGSKPATSSGEPSKSPASSSAPTNQKSGSLIPGIILGAILVGIGFAVAIVSAHYWQPLVGGEGEDPSEAIAALEQRLDTLESQPAGSSVSEDDVAALKAQIDGVSDEVRAIGNVAALEQRISDLEGKAPEVSPAELDSLNGKVTSVVGQMNSLADRVEALEARPVPEAGAAPGDVALILAANELEEEVLAGLDYSDELRLVRDLAGGDASVSALLTPLEASGSMIETRQGLAQSFAQILPDIVAAGYGEEQDDGLVSGVLERLSRVVSVRPVGDVEGDGPDAIAARAEARLANADLPGAVSELEKLQGKAAEIAAPWLASANARLAAEQSLNDLIALLLRRQANGESEG